MKSLDSFTVERLEELIGFTHGNGIDHANRTEWQALARIALAAKRAEPVYQYHTGIINEEGDIDWYWVDCDKGFYSQYDNQHRRIVYTTSQLNSQQGWIKCSDQMPEDDTLCLGVDECGVIWTMHFDDGEFRADTGDVDDLEISHWMPLPAAPEKPL
ncbi:DUF551 domain-containing protein [Yersinia enterocolitica]|uniref:DUF551 domain-containing protein n=1 Tax=Yersinia enterocolitica TaxID=630 RepID=UPI0028DA768E|nr:DUF551 domain-containing protein [Yersinia enterocolitica]HDZ8861703.1 DUF551 domain-containing protein [Yersinia enterocolitica]HEN3273094.1 DUF551 domain-containing protein [Yersinia enterocolitica]HEO8447032.1 DUF551 domain-containing protein [Yersinia enterocolitica]